MKFKMLGVSLLVTFTALLGLAVPAAASSPGAVVGQAVATAVKSTTPVPVPPKFEASTSKLVPQGKLGGKVVKGLPGKGLTKGGATTFSACSPPCFIYAGASRSTSGVTSVSTANRVAIPSLDQADNPGHTLGEMSYQNGNDIVEIGWNRDRGLYGETYPTLTTRLFVFAWYDNGAGGKTGCGYNGGCGYTDYVPNTTNAGSDISAANGAQKQMQIVQSGGRIWLFYDTNWIGSYPQNLTHGRSFTTANFIQTFGEIAAQHNPTCTDMGNSWLANGSNTYPTSGADFTSLNEATGGSYSLVAYTNHYATDATKWNEVNKSTGTILYGGPGYSPNPGACP